MILYLPTELLFGRNILKEFRIPQYKKIAIIISRTVSKNNYVKEIIFNYLKREKIDFQLIIPESGEPETNKINYLNSKLSDDIEALVGIGGGSILDNAKFLSVIYELKISAEEYDLGKKAINKASPIILIPTTSGSGSEATPYAVASNSMTNRKFTITSDFLFPRKSYIDPELILTLPRKVIINSSLDAFVHSLEALLNRNKSRFIENYAIESMKIIFNNLNNENLKNFNIDISEKLCLASLYGGISIAQSRTGMIHTFSAALSEFSNEAHGLLNAKILSEVIKFNISHFNGKLAEIVTKISGYKVQNDLKAINIMIKFVDNLIGVNSINFYKEVNINHVVDRVLQDKGLMNVNIKKFNRNDLNSIAKELICQG